MKNARPIISLCAMTIHPSESCRSKNSLFVAPFHQPVENGREKLEQLERAHDPRARENRDRCAMQRARNT